MSEVYQSSLWVEKYRPKTLSDYVCNDTVRHFVQKIIDTKDIPNILMEGTAGVGKAQPLYSKIMTETGYKTMGDMVVGERIFGENGNLHTVVGVFPQGTKDIYEIEFSCGEKVRCCNEHLWNVQNIYQRKKNIYTTKSLRDISNTPLHKSTIIKGTDYKIYNAYIPMTLPLNFIDREILIDPYILGLLIGDGGFTSGNCVMFSNTEDDVLRYISNFCEHNAMELIFSDRCSYRIKNKKRNNNVTPLTSNLIQYNLMYKKSEHKFIPKEYLFNSVQNRIELLSGLIDTDGEVNNSIINFSSTSKQLIDDVVFLVESLGGTVSCSNRQTRFNDENGDKKDGLPSYRLTIKMPRHIQPFKSEKHKSKWTQGQTCARRSIRKITYIGKEECQCIMTDNPTGLYLTNNCVVTHNTTIAKIIANETNSDLMYINGSIETSVDTIRYKVQQFCTTSAMFGGKKMVIIDECLEQNEEIEIFEGHVPYQIKLRDLEFGTIYKCQSYNLETSIIEDDTCELINERETYIYVIILEDGRQILCTDNHPFITKDNKEKSILDGLSTTDSIKAWSFGSIRDINIKMISFSKIGKVRNITVHKNHTIISSNGIISHNCERVSNQGQDALKVLLEETESNARFIFCTNNVHRVIPPLQSRCQLITFGKEKTKEMYKSTFKRICHILDTEKVEYDKAVISELTMKFYPDIRKIINECQKFITMHGKITPAIITSVNDSEAFQVLIDVMKNKKFMEMRKIIPELDFDGIYTRLYEEIDEYLENESKPNAILTIGEWQYKAGMSVDKELPIVCMCIELMKDSKFK